MYIDKCDSDCITRLIIIAVGRKNNGKTTNWDI